MDDDDLLAEQRSFYRSLLPDGGRHAEVDSTRMFGFGSATPVEQENR